MRKNKSSVYGLYGGVSDANHYIPPQTSEFNPQTPVDNTNTVITVADRRALTHLLSTTQFYIDHGENILLRVNTLHLSASNTDSFSMATFGKPEDVITYTSTEDVVNINIINGGEF